MVNRAVHILKAIDARGPIQKIGYLFDGRTLLFEEGGIIKKAKRQRDGKENAEG